MVKNLTVRAIRRRGQLLVTPDHLTHKGRRQKKRLLKVWLRRNAPTSSVVKAATAREADIARSTRAEA